MMEKTHMDRLNRNFILLHVYVSMEETTNKAIIVILKIRYYFINNKCLLFIVEFFKKLFSFSKL